MQMPAIFAGAELFGTVEFFEDRLHLGGNIGHEKILFVNFAAAVGAIPKQAIGHAGLPNFFDDEADGIGFALRRMRNFSGQEENFTFLDGDVDRLAVFDEAQHHVTFQLVEELLRFIVVKIGPRIGSAHDHDDKVVGFRPYRLVSDGWLEQVAIFVDPIFEAEGREFRHIRFLLLRSVSRNIA